MIIIWLVLDLFATSVWIKTKRILYTSNYFSESLQIEGVNTSYCSVKVDLAFVTNRKTIENIAAVFNVDVIT